jgi:hypothetical protein
MKSQMLGKLKFSLSEKIICIENVNKESDVTTQDSSQISPSKVVAPKILSNTARKLIILLTILNLF